MSMQTGVFVAIALLALPFQQAAADNGPAFNISEATSLMEAEYQGQLRRSQQAARKKATRKKAARKQAKRKIIKVSSPRRKAVVATKSRPVPRARPRYVAPVVRQPANVHQPARASGSLTDEFFDAASKGDVASLGRLLRLGVNINAANRERETALHMAAAAGHYSAVIYLVNQGANVNALTVKKWIPLHHAVRFRHANIANYLLKRGSYAQARTSDGLSAIDMAKATKNQHMVNLLGGR